MRMLNIHDSSCGAVCLLLSPPTPAPSLFLAHLLTRLFANPPYLSPSFVLPPPHLRFIAFGLDFPPFLLTSSQLSLPPSVPGTSSPSALSFLLLCIPPHPSSPVQYAQAPDVHGLHRAPLRLRLLAHQGEHGAHGATGRDRLRVRFESCCLVPICTPDEGWRSMEGIMTAGRKSGRNMGGRSP